MAHGFLTHCVQCETLKLTNHYRMGCQHLCVQGLRKQGARTMTKEIKDQTEMCEKIKACLEEGTDIRCSHKCGVAQGFSAC